MSFRGYLWITGTAVFVAALASAPAAAEPAPPEAPKGTTSAIEPPHPLAPLHADYPKTGQGDAEVVVLVVVAADGSVRSARALAGDEPFASAAVAASAGWRFEPATRDGKPIVASIRAQIRFTAPSAEEKTAPEPPKAPRSHVSTPRPVEVTVTGEHPPGSISLSRAEVRLLPGAFGDPFRAVDALPGVTPIASGIPYFFARGAPPGNVGYFIDGIRVPLLYHVALGPSVLNPAIMDRVDFYAGGYPASFGRFAGGIVSGETKEPPAAPHLEAGIRLVDTGAMVETPIKELGRIPFLKKLDGVSGSFFAAARFSYTGLLLSALVPSVSLDYWDYQARLALDVTPRDTLTIFAFGAHDFLATTTNGIQSTQFNTTFHRIDLRYDHRFGGPEDRIRQAITFGYDETVLDHGSHADDHMLSSRTEITKRAADAVLVRAGLDAQLDGDHADLSGGFFGDTSATDAASFSNRLVVTMGARADAVITVTPRFEVTPGVRFDVYESKGQVAAGVDPRLAARATIIKELRLVTLTALASQPPSFVLPLPGFTLDLDGGLQRSWQSSIGLEADLPWDAIASVTVFRNAFFNMTDALGTEQAPTPVTMNGPHEKGTAYTRSVLSNVTKRVDGSSIGMEILLRRRLTRRLGALVSYTLSRSQRILEHGVVPSAYDRTHVMNVAGTYDFGRGYRGSTRIVFYTGTPADPAKPALGRIPPFGRFDFRFEKRWSIARGRAWIAFVLEALNAFAAKETTQENCVMTPCSHQTIGPVTIPSIGLEGGF
jgi:TonB family protein